MSRVSRVTMTLACGNYERTAGIFDGSVSPQGVDLVPLALSPSEAFWRQIRFHEFDISEMSLSAHIMAVGRGESDFVGIPVFPSRVFRHSSILVLERSTIESPGDLRGKRVGVPEYHMSAALFARGLLSDEYGIEAREITWVQAGLDTKGRRERVRLTLPPDIKVEVNREETLSDLLNNGEIDALVTPSLPRARWGGQLGLRYLFDDVRHEEAAYFRRTGIFPIMHLIVVRDEVHSTYPWIAHELVKAFTQAKVEAEERARDAGALRSLLPWHQIQLEFVLEWLGEDFWPYGLEPNRPTLEAACRYSYEQGLSPRKVGVEELFASNTLIEPVK